MSADERQAELFVGVARLTRELHQAIFDSRLGALAHEQMPDACTSLDYVVQLTESAAHRTLDLVERSRGSLQKIHMADALLAAQPQANVGPALDLIRHGSAELREQLSQLAQAQEYQDLSGQLIKRVIGLVRGVEGALLELLRAAGPLQNPGAMPIAPTAGTALQGLAGPGVPGLNKGQVSQQDADALLSSLGF